MSNTKPHVDLIRTFSGLQQRAGEDVLIHLGQTAQGQEIWHKARLDTSCVSVKIQDRSGKKTITGLVAYFNSGAGNDSVIITHKELSSGEIQVAEVPKGFKHPN